MPDKKLKAVILVGGPGMRLRPLTEDRPKSVVPVLNRPAMEHTFEYLRRHGVEEIILAMNYLPDVIQECFGDGSRCGVRLSYCLEKEPLGTAGAVKNAGASLDSTFLVLNGDIFTDLDLADMLALHRKRKASASISLTWVKDPSAFGVVETDDNQRVKRFIEKPPLAEAASHWINAGIYILEPEVLGYIPANTHYMFERGLFPSLLKAGEPVYGYPYRGFWLDMGTPGTYFSLNVNMLEAKAGNLLAAGTKTSTEGIFYSADVTVPPTAVVKPPVLVAGGCRLGKGVHLTGPVIIGKDCRVDDGAVVENSVLWDNITVEANARVVNCIVCSRAVIAGNRKIFNSIVTPSNIMPLQR